MNSHSASVAAAADARPPRATAQSRKRKEAEDAAAVAAEGAERARSVSFLQRLRNRFFGAAAASSSSSSAAIATASRRPGAAHAACGAFSRLASVEVQSVLRFLPVRSLCLASATCRRLQLEADSPFVWQPAAASTQPKAEVWKPAVKPRRWCGRAPPIEAYSGRYVTWQEREQRSRDAELWSSASSLCCRFMPVRWLIEWQRMESLDETACRLRLLSAMQHLSRFGNVHSFEPDSLEVLTRMTRADALRMLSLRGLQHVREVTLSAGVWLHEELQSAICQLPHLNTLILEATSRANFRSAEGQGPWTPFVPPPVMLSHRALKSASQLHSVVLKEYDGTAASLAGLASLPALRSLKIDVQRMEQETRLQFCPMLNDLVSLPALWGLQRLTSLDLTSVSLHRFAGEPMQNFLASMPRLVELKSFNTRAETLFAALAALARRRPAALPNLRRVQWGYDDMSLAEDDVSEEEAGLDVDEIHVIDAFEHPAALRAMLDACPRLRVWINLEGDMGDPPTRKLPERYADLERVWVGVVGDELLMTHPDAARFRAAVFP